MTETAREKAAYRALEQLLDAEARTLQQVLAAARPLTGEEFEQVAEERALSGICGSPMCLNPLPQASSRRKIMRSTFCSTTCNAAVAELARGLGPVDAARHRFLHPTAASQPAQPQMPSGVISHGPRGGGGKRQKAADVGAYGGGVTVMSATVKERMPESPSSRQDNNAAAAHAAESAAQQASAEPQPAAAEPQEVSGNRPSFGAALRQAMAPPTVQIAELDAAAVAAEQQAAAPPAVPSVVEPESPAAAATAERPARAHVQFSDVVQERLIESREEAAASPQAPDRQHVPQQPVLVFNMEEPPPGAELGTMFGRLQVEDMQSGAAPMRREDPVLSSSPESRSQSSNAALSEVTERHSFSGSIGSVSERSVSERSVSERPAGDVGGGISSAAGGSTYGGVSERVVERSAAPQPPNAAPIAAAGRKGPARPVSRFKRQLQRDRGAVDEDAEYESDWEAAEAASDADSEGSDFSTFDNIHDAALDMEVSDEEDEGVMPRPFSRLSIFGQLFTQLDGLTTQSTLDLLQGEELQRRLADSTAVQRCSVYVRHLLAAMPRMTCALRIEAAPRSVMEQGIQDLASTLDFAEPISSMRGEMWDVTLLVMLKALSLKRLPALQRDFESREGVQHLTDALSQRDLSEEHFSCLLEVLLPEQL